MIGAFMGITFDVSHKKQLTFSGLSGKVSADWASHDVVGAKPKAQFIGPKARSYSLTIVLAAQYGVAPLQTLEQLRRACEEGLVDYFVLGDAPLSTHQFRITEVSESWDHILRNGKLARCKVDISIEEYV